LPIFRLYTGKIISNRVHYQSTNAMQPTLIPIVLAGGKGERFWPLSRQERPKQFLDLDGSGTTLLQSTVNRLLPLAGSWENVWVITSAALEEGTRSQLPQLPAANILVEPEGRDTAAAVAWGSIVVSEKYGTEAIFGFFPADHYIGNLDRFLLTLTAASELAAAEGAIVTLGIQPDYPATGYGYIQQGETIADYRGLPGYRVARFTEKPDRDTAEEFLSTGLYTWNSGMFVFSAATVLAELATHAAEIFHPLAAKGKDAYSEVPKLSIDYALMEKTDRACVIPANFGWDDLGDWNAIARLECHRDAKNVAIGNHVEIDTDRAIVYITNDNETVVTIGVENIVIVREGNATLIVDRDRTQDIKKVLAHLKTNSDLQHLL
jgi:mannose-1-phosphate guanylyltransferase